MTGLTNKATERMFPGFEKEKEQSWKGSFFFIQAADTQFGMIDSFTGRKSVITWDKEIALARKCIKAINAMTSKPKFFIICGDLVDAMPGTQYRSAQEDDFIKVFKELHPDVPLICVCGNHDVGNTPTQKSIENYRKKFGDDYFTFYCAEFPVFSIFKAKVLAKEQETWLDRELEEAKSRKYKHVILFQHVPWFLRNSNEEEIYFNNIKPQVRKQMLEKFYDANVRAIFCGHYHRNAGGFYKDLELVVTSAVGLQLGDDKSGFCVVKLGEDSIDHKYYAFDEAPQNITFD